MSNDEWTTPKKLFEFLDTLFQFELDMCATAENALCPVYFSREDDALGQDGLLYRGNVVWCNPPYSNCHEFVRKIVYEKPDKACILLPVRSDRQWFVNLLHHPDWKHSWMTGRLHFGGADKGAFMYNIVFYRHPTLVLPPSFDASIFNENGKGGART